MVCIMGDDKMSCLQKKLITWIFLAWLAHISSHCMAAGLDAPKADQNLLAKASKLTQVAYVSPNPITGGGWVTRYLWLSDNEVLLIDEIGFDRWNIVRENVITGKKQVLSTLIKRFDNSFGRLWQVVPSPHFKWLLWSMSGTDTSLLWGLQLMVPIISVRL